MNTNSLEERVAFAVNGVFPAILEPVSVSVCDGKEIKSLMSVGEGWRGARMGRVEC